MPPTICEDDFEPRVYRHNRLLRHHSVINYAVGQQSRKPIDLPIERANYVQRNDENSWNFKKMALNRYKFEESNQKTEIGTDNEDSMDSCSSDLMSYHNYAKRRRPNIQIENHLSSSPVNSTLIKNPVLSMSSATEDLEEQHHLQSKQMDCSLPPQSLVSAAPIASPTEIMALYRRFIKTPRTCQQRNLFEIAMKTIVLLRKNRMLQIRLQQLRMETRRFVDSVMSNPENTNCETISNKSDDNDVKSTIKLEAADE